MALSKRDDLIITLAVDMIVKTLRDDGTYDAHLAEAMRARGWTCTPPQAPRTQAAKVAGELQRKRGS